MHSVNTLSYASPFKTSPPKPRGPAPYDPQDPRTWNHEQTITWLTEEFTKRATVRRVAAHKTQAEQAARQGKKIRPLDPAAPVKLAVDVARLCPAGMTAKHYGQMTTTEFVQRCLEVASALDRDLTANVVKNTAAEVVGTLYYLILSAKTRKRRNIMKSRKAIDVDTYGRYLVAVSSLASGVDLVLCRRCAVCDYPGHGHPHSRGRAG